MTKKATKEFALAALFLVGAFAVVSMGAKK